MDTERLRKGGDGLLRGFAETGPGRETVTTRHDLTESEKALLIQVLLRRRAQIENSPFGASRRASLQVIDEVLGVLRADDARGSSTRSQAGK